MNVAHNVPPQHLRGCRILVVEDEFLAAEELSDFVLNRGATLVGPFPSLTKGLMGWAESDPVHVALLDIKLRDQVVYSLADALIARGVVVIFITGYAKSLLPDRFADREHIQKPFDIEALNNALFRLRSRWSKERRKFADLPGTE
jgi:two-component SAPR family response regulator